MTSNDRRRSFASRSNGVIRAIPRPPLDTSIHARASGPHSTGSSLAKSFGQKSYRSPPANNVIRNVPERLFNGVRVLQLARVLDARRSYDDRKHVGRIERDRRSFSHTCFARQFYRIPYISWPSVPSECLPSNEKPPVSPKYSLGTRTLDGYVSVSECTKRFARDYYVARIKFVCTFPATLRFV